MPPLHDEPPPYATIVFDCDSTLSAIEGIDELASAHHDAIAELTDRAMRGELSLESVYARRLEIVRPTRSEIERVGQLYVERVLPGARELVRALIALGKRVCIVSGGLAPAVGVLAEHLAIPASDVFAVGVRHTAEGVYCGFDERSPLARSRGKIEVVDAIRRATPGPLALVGDGSTDLEAAVFADRFVAFGGVVRRANVFAGAVASSTNPNLLTLIPLLVSDEERARIRHLRPTHER